MRYLAVLATASALFAVEVGASDNGLARTPAMGWNNWNTFGCSVSEDLFTSTAETIVNLGLRDAGYHYVVLDDCWSDGRFDNGTLRPNATRFPNGIKHLADRVHALDMGFGIYSDAGSMTCGRFAGSLGHEEDDAKTWASWGVDYLKYDNCFNEGESGTPQITYNRYKKMSLALNDTGRPILYSMCNWGEDYPWKWAQTVANSWRMSGDITDHFDLEDPRCPCTGDEGYDCALPGFHCSAMNILNKVSAYVDKGIPGSWNDLDMLEVGNKGMTDIEYAAHFTMWAAVKSPLIMGHDARATTNKTLSILTNPAVLAISQDPTGSSAVRRWRYFLPTNTSSPDEIQLWTGSLAHGDYVAIMLNLGRSAYRMNATAAEIFLEQGGVHSEEAEVAWDMYDLWANRMPDDIAQQVVDANGTSLSGIQELGGYYFNATAAGGFEDAIARNDTLLMGRMVGTLREQGRVEVDVPSHGVMAYRLKRSAHAAGELRKRGATLML